MVDMISNQRAAKRQNANVEGKREGHDELQAEINTNDQGLGDDTSSSPGSRSEPLRPGSSARSRAIAEGVMAHLYSNPQPESAK